VRGSGPKGTVHQHGASRQLHDPEETAENGRRRWRDPSFTEYGYEIRAEAGTRKARYSKNRGHDAEARRHSRRTCAGIARVG